MSKTDKNKTKVVKEEESDVIEETSKEQCLSFDFKTWTTESLLTKKTVHSLLEQDLNVMEALLMLTDEDVKELNVTLGQQRLLMAGINKVIPANLPMDPKKEKYQTSQQPPCPKTKTYH